jgi:hypothetical protein
MDSPLPANTGRAAAFGSQAQARGYQSTAIGAFSYAGWSGDGTAPATFADHTTALGAGAEAAADSATGVGTEAHALGANSTAEGAFSVAGFDNSAAFGAHVSTTRSNQMAFGLGSNTYTMAGINSSDSKAAQMGPTYFTTSDAAGNLATSSVSVGGLTDQVNKNTDGVAIALASAGPQILPSGKHFAVSGGYGNFGGASAFGVNAVAALNDSGLFASGGLGVGFSTGAVGGSAHVTYAW